MGAPGRAERHNSGTKEVGSGNRDINEFAVWELSQSSTSKPCSHRKHRRRGGVPGSCVDLGGVVLTKEFLSNDVSF